MTQSQTRRGVPFLVSAAAFVVLVAGIKAAAPILVPVLLAVFVAVISTPPLYWLKSKGAPTPVALALLLLGLAIAGSLLIEVVTASLSDFTASLPLYQKRIGHLLEQGAGVLASLGIEVSPHTTSQYLNTKSVMKVFTSVLGGFSDMLTNTFFIGLCVIFILLEAAGFPDKLRAALGESSQVHGPMEEVIEKIKKYVALKTLISLCTGAAVSIMLAILGVDYAVLWGLIAFLLNFVPNIGSILAALPAVLLAFIQLGYTAALWAGCGYLVINLVVGNVIEPRVMGHGVGLSALVVFLSLVLWGWILGPVGMVLSVPLTMALRIALSTNPDTKWIAVLLGPESDALETPTPEPNKESA